MLGQPPHDCALACPCSIAPALAKACACVWFASVSSSFSARSLRLWAQPPPSSSTRCPAWIPPAVAQSTRSANRSTTLWRVCHLWVVTPPTRRTSLSWTRETIPVPSTPRSISRNRRCPRRVRSSSSTVGHMKNNTAQCDQSSHHESL